MNDKSKVQCPVVRVQARIGAIVAGGATFLGDVTAFKDGDLAVLMKMEDARVSAPARGYGPVASSADGRHVLVPGINSKDKRGLVLALTERIAPDFSVGRLAHFGEGDDAAEFLGLVKPEAKPAAASWPFPTGSRQDNVNAPSLRQKLEQAAAANAVGPKYATLHDELTAIAAEAKRKKDEVIDRNWKVSAERLTEILRRAAQSQQSAISVDVAGGAVLNRLSDWAKSQGLKTSTTASRVWGSGAFVTLMWGFSLTGSPAANYRITEEGRLI